MATPHSELVLKAIDKLGSEAALQARLPEVWSDDQIAEIDGSRFLSMMSKCIFQAGFVWRVVEAKWPDFETVFSGFNPMGMAHLSEERIDEIAKDERIIRNRQKILTVRTNAQFILQVEQEQGEAFSRFIADWPEDNIVELWWLLKKRGARLGGMTGPRFLREMRKSTHILTPDVCRALVTFGFVDNVTISSKKSQTQAQQAFNDLQQESGWPLSHLSRLLALVA